MRKIILIMMGVISFSSCKKDALKDCKCGVIQDDAIENSNQFTLKIKNDCSGNTQKFYVTLNTWMDGVVGEPFCMDVIW